MNTRGQKRFEELTSFPYTLIAFPIDRLWVVEKNCQAFLEFWDLPRIARAGRLREMFGKVLFSISGYDHDERAIFEIPEVRNYLRRLTDAWPYFFYADNLKTPFLCELIKCIVPSVVVAATDADPTNSTTIMKTAEVERAYCKLFDGLVEACKMDAGMTDEIFEARATAVQKQIQARVS
jgi:hypothetical protein